jgi:4-amino-4-deoxy-L-arabinose transferase-like glycosyltransferase
VLGFVSSIFLFIVCGLRKLPFFGILKQSMGVDFNPPIFYWVSSFFFHLFGSDVAIRYPSIICGILLIPVMFVAGQTYKDELTGLYSAGFTAILFPLIYYSQFGRAYSMSVLFFAIALVFYIRIKKGDWQFSEWMFWVIAGINVWIHLYSIIPLGILMLDLVWENWEKRVFYVGIVIVMILPLASMFGGIPSRGLSYGATLAQMVLYAPFELFSVLFIPFAILVCGALWLRHPARNGLVVTMAGTVAMACFFAVLTSFYPRYLLTITTIVIVFAAVACSEIIPAYVYALKKVVPELSLDKYVPALQIFLLISILVAFVFLEKHVLIDYYTIQQYVCF